MTDAVDEEILGLRSRFWSERDPDGRGFAPLADAYRRAGELDEAVDLLDDGLDRLPDFTPGWVVAGRVHRDRGRAEAALEAFGRALELDPDNVVALRAAGELHEEAGRAEAALEHYRRLRALEPADPTLEGRIAALERPDAEPGPPAEGPAMDEPAGDEPTADEPAADEALEPTVAEDGEVAEDVVTATMAELYVRQGLTEKAADVYRRLLEREPDDTRFRERLDELERALRSEPAEADEPSGAPEPSAPSGLDRVERASEDADSLAEGMAPGPADRDEIESPFAWREEPEKEGAARAAEAAPVDESESLGRYFDVLLSWVPGAVPIESLAPDDRDVVPIESLAPDDRDVVPIESLAPDEGGGDRAFD